VLRALRRARQGALRGGHGGATVQYPCASACGGAPAAALWRSSRAFVAGRLLALVALAKRIMSRGPMTEHLANACRSGPGWLWLGGGGASPLLLQSLWG
jgi:hypothetical protein